MTNEHEIPLFDEVAGTTEGMLGLAAAELAACVSDLLHAAKKASGKSSKELAELLGVTEGRVSQVMNGDGNVHIATLARFIRAMGYEVGLEMRSPEADWSGADDTLANLDVYVQPFATDLGITEVAYVVEMGSPGSFPAGEPRKAGSLRDTRSRRRISVIGGASSHHSVDTYKAFAGIGAWGQPQEAS